MVSHDIFTSKTLLEAKCRSIFRVYYRVYLESSKHYGVCRGGIILHSDDKGGSLHSPIMSLKDLDDNDTYINQDFHKMDGLKITQK